MLSGWRCCGAGGRMLLSVPLTAARPAEGARKRKRHDKVLPGTVVRGTVLAAHPLHVDVQLADDGEPVTKPYIPQPCVRSNCVHQLGEWSPHHMSRRRCCACTAGCGPHSLPRGAMCRVQI